MLLREDKYIIYVALDRYICSKIRLNYRIQGKFSRHIRWGGSAARWLGGSVVLTHEPPSRQATKLYNLD